MCIRDRIRPGGHVLDVACGRSGRHLRWLAAQGFCLTGIDADPAAALDLPPRARVLVPVSYTHLDVYKRQT